jgi:hypothetical protein
MNRKEIEKQLSTITSDLLREKGFIAPVDVFIRLGWLDVKDYEAWRHRRVPYLEAVIQGSLSRMSFTMKLLRRGSLRGKLKPSWTGYCSWGKKRRRKLRFSKSGSPGIEEAYATHYVKMELKGRSIRESDGGDPPGGEPLPGNHPRPDRILRGFDHGG